MESVHLLGASLLLLIFVVASVTWELKFVASYEKENNPCYEHYNFFNACDPNPTTPPMSREIVTTVSACSAKCQLLKGCMAFLYAPESGSGGKGVCRTYNVTLAANLDPSCSDYVTYGQVEMATCRPLWRPLCSSNANCNGDRRICQDGRCTCEPGYMFEPSSGDCVEVCNEYNDKFSEAASTSFNASDAITHTGISKKDCMEKCLNQACRSYQFDNNDEICVLSNETVITTPNSTGKDPNNQLFQRECAYYL